MKFLFQVFWLTLVFSPVLVEAAENSVLYDNRPNPAAVQQVNAGQLEIANAAWWGFDETDSTDTLQAAIDSPVKKLIVPNMGKPWIVRPMTLKSDFEIVFEPGSMVLAKRGEFKGGGDSLFTARSAQNLKIKGYNATWRMWKKDYQNPPYQRAEWRMGLSIRGCKNVLVEGLHIESSGGDGIYIDGGGAIKHWSEDVTIGDCVCRDHHRQGISIIGAVNLLIENCTFSETKGTPPEAGIDFEPDSPNQKFVNCVVRNCLFKDNSGHQVLVYLKPMTTETEDISIRFENCVSRMGEPGMTKKDFTDPEMTGWSGFAVGAIKEDGPGGKVEFINCATENTGKEGIKIFDKSANRTRVIFENCTLKNSWVSRHQDFGGPRVPILIQVRRPAYTDQPGGVDFIGCKVFDSLYAPVLRYDQERSDFKLYDVQGEILVDSPYGEQMVLGDQLRKVNVRLIDLKKQESTQ